MLSDAIFILNGSITLWWKVLYPFVIQDVDLFISKFVRFVFIV